MPSALLIIDTQRALFGESFSAYDGDAILARIAALRARAEKQGVPIFYMRHEGPADSPMARGTTGWELHSAIAPEHDDAVIDKRASDSFYETRLGETLARLAVDRVVITGYATEACVDTTVRRAISEGFDVTLVSDCHTTGDWTKATDPPVIIAHHNRTLAQLAHPDCSVSVVPADDVEF